MAKIQGLTKDALSGAPGSQGITRHMAFRGEGFLIVRSRVDPGVVSGWHHHGDYDVYGYAISVGPGDFFHVPARSIHRDVNPSTIEGQEVVLFLRGTGPMVVNAEGPDPG